MIQKVRRDALLTSKSKRESRTPFYSLLSPAEGQLADFVA
jgi:hypothetical protein